MPYVEISFALAAGILTIEALLYAGFATRRIEAAVAPEDAYWRKRLGLNLFLASHGMAALAATAWTSVAVFAGAPTASAILALVVVVGALASVISIVAATPKDWPHAIPRGMAAALIAIGFGVASVDAPPGFTPGVDADRPSLIADLGHAGEPMTIRRGFHAMAAIDMGGDRIITDPWWSSRPHYEAGEANGLSVSDMRAATLILSTQNHYDHSDFANLPMVARSTPVIVPAGTGQSSALAALGFKRVIALEPWRSVEIGGFSVTAVPSRDAKTADFDYELAYIIRRGGRTALFVGHRIDAAAVAEIARRFAPPDVAFLPVNDLRVRPQLMKQLSLSPDDAAAVATTIKARIVVPIHYAYRGSWIQRALLLSHTGTPDQLSARLAETSPQALTAILAPGQPLVVR